VSLGLGSFILLCLIALGVGLMSSVESKLSDLQQSVNDVQYSLKDTTTSGEILTNMQGRHVQTGTHVHRVDVTNVTTTGAGVKVFTPTATDVDVLLSLCDTKDEPSGDDMYMDISPFLNSTFRETHNARATFISCEGSTITFALHGGDVVTFTAGHSNQGERRKRRQLQGSDDFEATCASYFTSANRRCMDALATQQMSLEECQQAYLENSKSKGFAYRTLDEDTSDEVVVCELCATTAARVVDPWTDQGNRYCTDYDGHERRPGQLGVEECKAACEGSEGCNAIAISASALHACTVYAGCNINDDRYQKWGYTFFSRDLSVESGWTFSMCAEMEVEVGKAENAHEGHVTYDTRCLDGAISDMMINYEEYSNNGNDMASFDIDISRLEICERTYRSTKFSRSTKFRVYDETCVYTYVREVMWTKKLDFLIQYEYLCNIPRNLYFSSLHHRKEKDLAAGHLAANLVALG